MYNLLEYSDNYADSSGNNDGNLFNIAINNSTSFKYKAILLGKATGDDDDDDDDGDDDDRSLKMQKELFL